MKSARPMIWAQVDPEVRKALVALAAAEGISLSDIVRRAIRTFLRTRAA